MYLYILYTLILPSHLFFLFAQLYSHFDIISPTNVDLRISLNIYFEYMF